MDELVGWHGTKLKDCSVIATKVARATHKSEMKGKWVNSGGEHHLQM